MTIEEYQILPSPVRNRQRLNLELNPVQSINYTVFIPPTVTGEQYIISDRSMGVAIHSVKVLDDAVNKGSIAVLGNGGLIVL